MKKIFDRKTIIANLKVIAVPFVVFVSSVVLLVVIIMNYYPKIKSMFKNFDESKKRNLVLEDRVRVLSEFRIDAKAQTDISAIALPISNPGTLILSHIKNISTGYGIEIVDVSFEASDFTNDKVQWKKMKMTLDTRNDNIASYLNFLSDISKIIPIITVDSVKLSKNKGFIDSTGTISIYWSDPPETIMSLSSPIQNLTEEENETLSFIENLKAFEITKLQPGSFDESRVSPFN